MWQVTINLHWFSVTSPSVWWAKCPPQNNRATGPLAVGHTCIRSACGKYSTKNSLFHITLCRLVSVFLHHWNTLQPNYRLSLCSSWLTLHVIMSSVQTWGTADLLFCLSHWMCAFIYNSQPLFLILIDLNAEITFFTVPIETLSSWTVFVTNACAILVPMLNPLPKSFRYFLLAILIHLDQLGLLIFHKCYKSMLECKMLNFTMQYLEVSVFVMFLHLLHFFF